VKQLIFYLFSCQKRRKLHAKSALRMRPCELTINLKKMSRKKKILIPVVIVLVIVWIGVARSGALKPDENEASAEGIIPKVEIQVVEKRDVVKVLVFLSGKIKPKKYTLVKSKSNGFLQYIMPISEEVRAGQELFKIYDEGVEANYYNALAGLVTAQQNLTEVEAVSGDSVRQAELGVKSADAGLNLARKSLENTRKSMEQGIESALDSGRASYSSAYNSVEQMMRFLGGGDTSNYAFGNLHHYNSLARTRAEERFNRASSLFADRTDRTNIEERLEELEELIEEVKLAGDLAYIDLNYSIGDINVAQTVIDGYKAQVSGLLLSLNGANSAIKGVSNGIKSARIARDSTVEAAEIGAEQAENGLANARAVLDLARSGIKTRKLGAQAQLNGAQAQFDMAKYQYDNLIMPAKFSGTVISNLVEVGDQVNIGVPVLELGDVSMVEIELEVGTREARQLVVGQEVRIGQNANLQMNANAANITNGTLTEIEPAALGASGKVKIKVEADNSNYQFVPGEVAEVEIELVYVGEDLVVIPLSSVIVGQNESYVFIVSPSPEASASKFQIEKRVVVTGEVYGSLVEIVSGLDVGDRVVVEGGGFLGEGDVVEVSSF